MPTYSFFIGIIPGQPNVRRHDIQVRLRSLRPPSWKCLGQKEPLHRPRRSCAAWPRAVFGKAANHIVLCLLVNLQSFLLVATDQRLPVGLLSFLAEHIKRGHGRDQDLCGQARRGPTVRTFRLHGRRTVVELNHQRNWQNREKSGRGWHDTSSILLKLLLNTVPLPSELWYHHVQSVVSEQRDQGKCCSLH